MASILGIGTSALLSFQRSLNTTGHNIANSDTEGYSRQRTQFATHLPELTGAGFIGSGVQAVKIERLYDDFIATQMRTAASSSSELGTYFDHASRVDNILADPNVGLDPALQNFFDAVQVLADDPTSIPSRQVVMSEAQSLVDRFHDLGRQFNTAREELDQEFRDAATEISTLGKSIAAVNQSIIEAIGASGGEQPNDLLDQREVLFNKLSEMVSITLVEQDNGAMNVFIGNGQALVIGSTPATLTTVQSASDLTELELALSKPSGTQVITAQLNGGELGGLLTYRDQILNPGQNQLGLLAIGVADRLNSQHQLGLDLNGDLGGQMFSLPAVNGIPNTRNLGAATVSAAFVDTGNLTSSDYELQATTVANQFTLTRLSDGQVTSLNAGGGYPFTSTEIDGFSLTISAAAAAGDKFLVRPTRGAPMSISFEISDARKLAAAGPVRAQLGSNTGGGPNQGTAAISQPAVSNTTNLPLAGVTLTFDPNAGGAGVPGFAVVGGPASPILYDPATESAGKTFTFATHGGMAFDISGTPSSGDRLVIEHNAGGIGDNRNALLLGQLSSQNTLLGTTGGGLETATFQEAYAQLVADVGTKTHQANNNFEAVDGLRERHKNSLLSTSGVNLDEEAANLVKFQQAYQAAAQVISVAGTLFDTLIGAVRR